MTDSVLAGFGAVSVRDTLAVISRTQRKPIPGGTESSLSVLTLRLARPEAMIGGDGCSVQLSYIRPAGAEVRIGSLTTRSQLLRSPLIAEHCKLLLEAVQAYPSQGPDTPATIGAALCRPGASDGVAWALIALRASVVIRSRREQRIVPISEFRRRRSLLSGRGDLVTEIRIPLRPAS